MKYYAAFDGMIWEEYEADSMEDAIGMARERWIYAEPGTHEVTIYEYPSYLARCEGNGFEQRRTITVTCS